MDDWWVNIFQLTRFVGSFTINFGHIHRQRFCDIFVLHEKYCQEAGSFYWRIGVLVQNNNCEYTPAIQGGSLQIIEREVEESPSDTEDVFFSFENEASVNFQLNTFNNIDTFLWLVPAWAYMIKLTLTRKMFLHYSGPLGDVWQTRIGCFTCLVLGN